MTLSGPTRACGTLEGHVEVTESRAASAAPDPGLDVTRNAVCKQDGSRVVGYGPARLVTVR